MFQAFSKIRKVGKAPPKTPTKVLKSAPAKSARSPNQNHEQVSNFTQTQKIMEPKVIDVTKLDQLGQELLSELYNTAIPMYETEQAKIRLLEVQRKLEEEEAKQRELLEQIERKRLAEQAHRDQIEKEQQRIKQNQSAPKKKQLVIDTEQLNNSHPNILSANNKKVNEKKDINKKQTKPSQIRNSHPKKMVQNHNSSTTHVKSHHSISPTVKQVTPHEKQKKQSALNLTQRNQVPQKANQSSRSQNSVSPSMNNLKKRDINKTSDYLKVNKMHQESNISVRSQHSNEPAKTIDHQIKPHQQSNISVRSNEPEKKNSDITDLAAKFKQLESRFQNQKPNKKEIVPPKKWFQVSPKKQQKSQQDSSPESTNIDSAIRLQENLIITKSDENIIEQLVPQRSSDKMLVVENQDDELQEEPQKNIPEFQRMPSMESGNRSESQRRKDNSQEHNKPDTSKDSFQLKYKNPDSTRNNQSTISNDFVCDQHVPLHLRYQTILQRREQQLEYQRQRKKQIEKEKEERSLTFRPDLSLTKKDKRTRAVDEFIRDQEEWSESKKRMNSLRKEQIEQKEINQNTFSPYLSEKSRKIAFAKNERLGGMKAEDRLFEQHILTQEKLKEARERTQPTFKPSIDQNSRNIVRQKRSQYNSQNSSMVNDLSQ